MNTNYEAYYKLLGLKIAYYRKLRGYTQEQFAERIGKSWSFIAQIESPNIIRGVSLETLFSMAEALEIKPYMLLRFEDDLSNITKTE